MPSTIFVPEINGTTTIDEIVSTEFFVKFPYKLKLMTCVYNSEFIHICKYQTSNESPYMSI